MYLQTIQASALRTIFEVLKDIVNDVNVYFTPEGVRMDFGPDGFFGQSLTSQPL